MNGNKKGCFFQVAQSSAWGHHYLGPNQEQESKSQWTAWSSFSTLHQTHDCHTTFGLFSFFFSLSSWRLHSCVPAAWVTISRTFLNYWNFIIKKPEQKVSLSQLWVSDHLLHKILSDNVGGCHGDDYALNAEMSPLCLSAVVGRMKIVSLC